MLCILKHDEIIVKRTGVKMSSVNKKTAFSLIAKLEKTANELNNDASFLKKNPNILNEVKNKLYEDVIESDTLYEVDAKSAYSILRVDRCDGSEVFYLKWQPLRLRLRDKFKISSNLINEICSGICRVYGAEFKLIKGDEKRGRVK